MLNDTFKIRYKKVPLAVYFQRDRRDTLVHNHAEFEIVRITEGSCRLLINERSYQAGKGDMIFINPFEVHSIQVNASEDFSHQCICFDCVLIREEKLRTSICNEELQVKNYINVNDPIMDFVADTFLHILSAHEKSREYLDTEIASWISLLFVYLAHNHRMDAPVRKTGNTMFCARVLEYIAAHYPEKITSREAAEALCFNQSYFCRVFRKNFGRSFSDYLNRYRVGASRMLLEAGDKTIAEIALTCGFDTQAHYSECFKKYLGILPSRYRRGQFNDPHQ